MQPERAGGLYLAVPHRLDARAHNFDGVGAAVQHHGDQCAGIRVETHHDGGQAEENQKHLHQERGVAHRFDIGRNGGAQRRRSGGAAECAEHGNDKAEHHRDS